MKVIGWIVAVLVGLWILNACVPKDSTDPESGRSGMGLRIDYATGCHYLTSASLIGESGITPRLDSDGRHVCTGPEAAP